MRIKILTEAGSDIGYGHLSRMTSLYDEALTRGIDVELIVHGQLEAINFLGNREIRNLAWMDRDFIDEEIQAEDYLIIDSYLAGPEIYEKLAEQSKKLLYIDDTNRLSYPAGIIVNPAIGIGNLNYKIKKGQELYYGLDYIILRQPFQEVVVRKQSQGVKDLLIVMGGTDPQDLAGRILERVRKTYPELKIHILVNQGKLALYLNYYESIENLFFYSNLSASQMRDLMLSVDLAISAGGQTVYELLACQTPLLPVATADNQESHLEELLRLGMVPRLINVKREDWLDDLEEGLAAEMNNLAGNSGRSANENADLKRLIDGKGSKRIIELLLRMG